jgi:hypothetical protein
MCQLVRTRVAIQPLQVTMFNGIAVPSLPRSGPSDHCNTCMFATIKSAQAACTF